MTDEALHKMILRALDDQKAVEREHHEETKRLMGRMDARIERLETNVQWLKTELDSAINGQPSLRAMFVNHANNITENRRDLDSVKRDVEKVKHHHRNRKSWWRWG